MDDILNLLHIFYLITNHSFNKVGILMNTELDKKLKLPENSSWYAVITSTFLAAAGKLIGSFIEVTSIRYAVCSLFLLNGIFMYITLNTNNLGLFILFRNLQGFISGLQTSIIIGFIGSMPDNKKGFANYTGISAVVSLITSIVIQKYGTNISYLLLLLNLVPTVMFFFLLKDFNQTYKTVPIITSHIYDAMRNWRFWLYALLVGIMLSLGLYGVRLQNEFINIWGTKLMKDNRFIVSGLVFILSSIISFIPAIQNKKSSFFISVSGIVSYYLAIKFKCIYLGLYACISMFLTFSAINPLLCHKVTEVSADKFVNSSIFFSVRSAITSIGLWLFSLKYFCCLDLPTRLLTSLLIVFVSLLSV